MKLTPHAPPKRAVHQLVLADPRHPRERLAYHPRGVMVAVAGKVADGHFRVRQRRPDQVRDLVRRHWHRYCPSTSWRLASTVRWSSASRMLASSVSTPALVRSPS